MDQLIGRCKPRRALLADALRDILREGLAYIDGCVLLNSQLKLTQANVRTQFQDKTGYECFVNHIHLEDILLSANECDLLEQALAFADEITILKENTGISEKLGYIIAAGENEVNVRFYVLRAGEDWLADDLEAYGEAIAILRLPNA